MSSSGPSIPSWIFELAPLVGFVNVLVDFASNPLRFIRSRLFPPLIGGIFGFIFNIAEIIAIPFNAINQSLLGSGSSPGLLGAILNAISAIFAPLEALINSLIGFIAFATAPFGPLQPFVAIGVILLAGYLGGGLLIRALRSALNAIPGGGAIDTFIFG